MLVRNIRTHVGPSYFTAPAPIETTLVPFGSSCRLQDAVQAPPRGATHRDHAGNDGCTAQHLELHVSMASTLLQLDIATGKPLDGIYGRTPDKHQQLLEQDSRPPTRQKFLRRDMGRHRSPVLFAWLPSCHPRPNWVL